MALSGTVVRQVAIKLDGDVLFKIYRYKQHHIHEMSPGCVISVDMHEGEWGIVGTVIFWNFIHDGKAKVAKMVFEAIDEEKKSLCFKMIGGDLMEAYKNFLVTIHMDTKGKETLVTWTFNYKKVNENVEDPDSLMDVCLSVTKDIENYHLAKSK